MEWQETENTEGEIKEKKMREDPNLIWNKRTLLILSSWEIFQTDYFKQGLKEDMHSIRNHSCLDVIFINVE